MKINYRLTLSAIAGLTLFFTSCKKEENALPPADYTAETANHTDDQNQFSTGIDALNNDADLALEATPGFAGRISVENLIICDAAVDYDTIGGTRTITITYNGNVCGPHHTRTGKVTLSMPQQVRWKNPGAAVTVTFENVKITRIFDNKSITLNGTQVYTNVSGGLLINLPSQGPVTHTITSSGLNVAFGSGNQRTWSVAKQRVFSFNNGVAITTTGLHTEGSLTGIAEWGTNRYGNFFTTAIAEPLIIRQDCDFRLVTGKVVHNTQFYTASATFGLNASGNATSCPGTGNYFLKLTWTGPMGNTHTSIHPY